MKSIHIETKTAEVVHQDIDIQLTTSVHKYMTERVQSKIQQTEYHTHGLKSSSKTIRIY